MKMIIKFWILFLPIIVCMNPDDIEAIEFYSAKYIILLDMVFCIRVF